MTTRTRRADNQQVGSWHLAEVEALARECPPVGDSRRACHSRVVACSASPYSRSRTKSVLFPYRCSMMVTPELTAKQVKIAQNTPLLRSCRTVFWPGHTESGGGNGQ